MDFQQDYFQGMLKLIHHMLASQNNTGCRPHGCFWIVIPYKTYNLVDLDLRIENRHHLYVYKKVGLHIFLYPETLHSIQMGSGHP